MNKKTSRPLSDDWRNVIEETRRKHNEALAECAAKHAEAEKAREAALLRKIQESAQNASSTSPTINPPVTPPPLGVPTAADPVDQSRSAQGATPAERQPADARDSLRSAHLSELRKGITRFMLHPDPMVCLSRICQYALNMTADEERDRAEQLFGKFRFYDLYPDAQADWEEEFNREFDKLAKDHRWKGLPLFVVERVVREVIPGAQRVYNSSSGTKRQDIQAIELAYVMKSIVSTLRKRGCQRAERMARGYFLTPKYLENYKQATKRRLNTGKLARITDLLHQHGLVEKVRKTKFDTLHFKLGPKAVLIPKVPVPNGQSCGSRVAAKAGGGLTTRAGRREDR